jgi:hypothetical protein
MKDSAPKTQLQTQSLVAANGNSWEASGRTTSFKNVLREWQEENEELKTGTGK